MTFQCLQGCHDCCGVVPIRPEVYYANKDNIQKEPVEIIQHFTGDIIPVTDDRLCVFLRRGYVSRTDYCAIYNDRPEVCRAFGLSQRPELQCPHLKPSGARRSEASTKQILKAYKVTHERVVGMTTVRRIK